MVPGGRGELFAKAVEITQGQQSIYLFLRAVCFYESCPDFLRVSIKLAGYCEVAVISDLLFCFAI